MKFAKAPLAGLFLCLSAAVVWAGPGDSPTSPNYTKPAQFVPLGYCQLTGMSAATLLSACSGGIPDGSTSALITVEAQSVRYRDDGTSPTSSVGMILTAAQSLSYAGALGKIKFIEVTSGAILNVSFYK